MSRDVTAYTESTAPSTVAFWTVFTELLPGNALVKSVTVQQQDQRGTATACNSVALGPWTPRVQVCSSTAVQSYLIMILL
jgi:hypothetical protein